MYFDSFFWFLPSFCLRSNFIELNRIEVHSTLIPDPDSSPNDRKPKERTMPNESGKQLSNGFFSDGRQDSP